MAVTFRYLGWTAFEVILEDGRRIALDPMLAGQPEQDIPPSPCGLEECDGVDIVMVTHVATDHVGQAFSILKRSKAKLICDISTRYKALAAGIPSDRVLFMVSGVQFQFDGLFIKALAAQHVSFSQLSDGSFISSQPLSYLIKTPGGVRIFFGGDTSITTDHRLFGQLYKPHVAILAIGGLNMQGQSFTELYPDEAALLTKWLGAKIAFPMHYRLDEGTTFAKELKKRAPRVQAVLLKPGESYRFTPSRTATGVRQRVPPEH